jgi:hypothetical protein
LKNPGRRFPDDLDVAFHGPLRLSVVSIGVEVVLRIDDEGFDFLDGM